MAVSLVLDESGGGADADPRPGEPAAGKDRAANGRPIERAILAFVVLGVLLRIGRYLINYPVWGDEACLALSFPRRGYLDLLLPLEYGQICPILFLWAELTAVKLFGFSEMSLRLCPLICGVGERLPVPTRGRPIAGRSRAAARRGHLRRVDPSPPPQRRGQALRDRLAGGPGAAGPGDRVVPVARADRLALDAGRIHADRAGGFVSGRVRRGGNRTGTGTVRLEDATTRADDRPRGLSADDRSLLRDPVPRLHASPAESRRLSGGTPEVLGRFLPPARLAPSAGEMADLDPRRQHARLSRRRKPRRERRDADPGAHRLGRPLATGPQDDPPAPRDADGTGAWPPRR